MAGIGLSNGWVLRADIKTGFVDRDAEDTRQWRSLDIVVESESGERCILCSFDWEDGLGLRFKQFAAGLELSELSGDAEGEVDQAASTREVAKKLFTGKL